jgi:ribonuclease HI
MELAAIRAALRALRGDVEVLSDSRYAIDCVTKWVYGWRKSGWVTSSGSPVANRELVEDIVALCQGRTVEFTWVRGHSGHRANERADALARQAAASAS